MGVRRGTPFGGRMECSEVDLTNVREPLGGKIGGGSFDDGSPSAES
jgi:hypothetical protein